MQVYSAASLPLMISEPVEKEWVHSSDLSDSKLVASAFSDKAVRF
jgi:hypothetical protein